MTPDELDDDGRICGISRVAYPSEPEFGLGYVEFIVVLTRGFIGDYAAYAGKGSPEWVRDHGDKLSYRMACGHFPDLPAFTEDGKLYRER